MNQRPGMDPGVLAWLVVAAVIVVVCVVLMVTA